MNVRPSYLSEARLVFLSQQVLIEETSSVLLTTSSSMCPSMRLECFLITELGGRPHSGVGSGGHSVQMQESCLLCNVTA